MNPNTHINLYEKDVSMLYDYGIKKKLVTCKNLRRKGFEVDTKPKPRGTASDHKEDSNVARSRQSMYELAYCNPWELFVTMTLNPAQYDRTDLKGYHASLTQWFRNYGKKHGFKIDFLIIPELHKDGKSWHVHGLLMGLPLDHLTPFTLEQTLPYYVLNQLKKGKAIYNWLAYQEKFGYINVEAINNREHVAKYITKYITKDLSRSVSAVGAHMYYVSRGLQRKKLIEKGTLSTSVPYDFTNDYVSVKWIDKSIDTTNLIRPELERKRSNDTPPTDIKAIFRAHEKHIKEIEERQLYKFDGSVPDDMYCPFD